MVNLASEVTRVSNPVVELDDDLPNVVLPPKTPVYQLFEIGFPGNRVRDPHPDRPVLSQMLEDFKSFIPSAELRATDHYFMEFHKLQRRDAEVERWIWHWVEEHGFEPFSVYHMGQGEFGEPQIVVYCFRRVINR